ncbi:peptidoglycan editing factor PgeF [Polynucleobacter paludilacus]|uniref:peptidoglycan editing factor PgeF n=1 Tax=Polynucleobacter paludilacus TaxID=1855895 RepID=UPI001BFDFCC5|nr:peptidoglycan editing factor PgeF [Polynucleobacter paludilacus]QWD86288.1 peptidoglycan editing factor PgeF [Polynucleobacter paludilacus]
MDLISADWPAPKRVHTTVTLRTNGHSVGSYNSLNLGDHVGDDPSAVLLNRQLLRAVLPSEPLWMRQTHGTLVSTTLSRVKESMLLEADAAVTNQTNEVLAVLTADCLPVFFCSADGQNIGVAHAGWRGLCAGILENTVSALVEQAAGLTPSALMAWLGPAIGQNHFEVGKEVLESFAQRDFEINPQTFQPIPQKPGKYLANLDLLAHQALKRVGIQNIYGGGLCTYAQSSRFFSHRRDGVSGRFASLIWIEP